MEYVYTRTDPGKLMKMIVEEAYCILEMQAESGEQTEEISLYLAGLSIAGKAWELQEEAEAALKGLNAFAHNPEAPAPKGDTWTPTDEQILSLLWGLFDTAVRLEDREEREQIRQLAQQMTDFHGLDIRVRPL